MPSIGEHDILTPMQGIPVVSLVKRAFRRLAADDFVTGFLGHGVCPTHEAFPESCV